MSDLIERAREASTLKYQYHTIHVPTILERLAVELERLVKENEELIAKARADALEEAAKIADDWASGSHTTSGIAAAIRKLGENNG